jgi:hypothetical protein
MSKTTPVRCYVPPQVVKDFAGVRGRVIAAVKAAPRSVTFLDAVTQIREFGLDLPKK